MGASGLCQARNDDHQFEQIRAPDQTWEPPKIPPPEVSSAQKEREPLETTTNDPPQLFDSPPAKKEDEPVEPLVQQVSAVEDQPKVEEVKTQQQIEEEVREKMEKEEFEDQLPKTRDRMKSDPNFLANRPANRYGSEVTLPDFIKGKHVPVLALINPMSGAMAGTDILEICRRTGYYNDRFFNIIDVVKDQRRGGLLDVFRIELCLAKDEAKAMGTRPRLISGGGDGTGSFTIFMIFRALLADPDRAADGLADSGNGFIWSDAELAESFPAIAQMPLGSANDFGNILGWGQKYPGDQIPCCGSRSGAHAALCRWMAAVIDPNTRVVNFDIWGIMPKPGQENCNFKLAELTGRRGRCPNEKLEGQRQLQLKLAGKPVPLFVCLYFSTGFGAYMTARFQINRRKTPIKNRAEYTRQAIGIITEPTPPQLNLRLNGIEIDCESKPYFPPRRHLGTQGRGYREVGFYNINWQAHALHGADRASPGERICTTRQPVKFNDGLVDMYRWKFLSLAKNPGLRVQTDKKKGLDLTYKGEPGRGVFFQWDGEARFAFSATGESFNINIRKALTIPVLIGPYHDKSLTGDLDNGKPVAFEFSGDAPEDVEAVKNRIRRYVRGELEEELNATREEILGSRLRHSATED